LVDLSDPTNAEGKGRVLTRQVPLARQMASKIGPSDSVGERVPASDSDTALARLGRILVAGHHNRLFAALAPGVIYGDTSGSEVQRG
jgi:hypothetical protein